MGGKAFYNYNVNDTIDTMVTTRFYRFIFQYLDVCLVRFKQFSILYLFVFVKTPFLWGEGPIYDVPDYLNRRPRLYGCTVMIINLFQCIILFVIPWSIFHFGVTMVTDMYLYGILLLTFVIGCPFAVSGMITLSSWLELFGDGD